MTMPEPPAPPAYPVFIGELYPPPPPPPPVLVVPLVPVPITPAPPPPVPAPSAPAPAPGWGRPATPRPAGLRLRGNQAAQDCRTGSSLSCARDSVALSARSRGFDRERGWTRS